MYANKFQCTCPCGQQVCLLLCSLKYCILNIFQSHACPWKYHVVWTEEKKEDWVTVVTFKQTQNSLRYTVVPSSWIDTLGEDEIWIIVRFYVFTMSFFLVLWTKDHDGGGEKPWCSNLFQWTLLWKRCKKVWMQLQNIRCSWITLSANCNN